MDNLNPELDVNADPAAAKLHDRKAPALFTPHRNTGSSRFCGPTAIMAITGLPGSDVRDAIRQARGNIMSAAGSHMPVAGLSNADLLATMAVLGWQVVEQWTAPDGRLRMIEDAKGDWHLPNGKMGRYARPEGFSPAKFSDFLRERGSDGPFIVNVTGHYMAASGGEVCDAYDTGLPKDIDRYLTRGKPKYRNSWVWKWWKFASAETAP